MPNAGWRSAPAGRSVGHCQATSRTDLSARSCRRRRVGRRFGLPAPKAITTVGAWLLGSDPALALTGRKCAPARLLREGDDFRETDIDEAVSKTVNQRPDAGDSPIRRDGPTRRTHINTTISNPPQLLIGASDR